MNLKHITLSIIALTAIGSTAVTSATSVSAATTASSKVQVAPSSDVIYINNDNGAKVYHNVTSGKVATSANSVQTNTAWSIDKTAMVNGKTYYEIGNDTWVSSSDVSFNAPVVAIDKVLYVSSNGGNVNLYSSANDGYYVDNSVSDGNAYHVYAQTTDQNGQVWYNLGSNEWINGQYMTEEEPSVKYTMSATAYDPAVLGSSMGYSGVAANLSRFPKGTQLKITLGDGTVMYRTVNDTGYFALSNSNQLDIAMPNSQALSFGRQTITVQVVK
ncbi:hypothetical protein [Companilactobacillus metriopterae]|uniref:hypothetical protein n=1 Tax=Companilactobacillus metriopterae TaxID=1909267 RepID=UPI00100A2BCD